MSDSPRRAGWLAALALAAAVLAGGALGYALGSRPAPMRLKQGPSILGVSRAALLDSLGLDARQRVGVDSILDAAERGAEGSITRMMDEVRGITRDAKGAVRALLTPDQLVRFDSILVRAVPPLPRSPLPPRDSGR